MRFTEGSERTPRSRAGLWNLGVAHRSGLDLDIQSPVMTQFPPVLDKPAHRQFEFGEFIGCSPQMMQVYDQIRRAAAVDSTVLVMGESGTGKELVARALHKSGPRKGGPLVAVDCTAVPEALVESELFGHVRGAFTGAIDARIGRFQQAEGGTLLIDELGNLALRLQAKLLRVLETRAVTPVGGTKEHRTDVRVVAATNRDIHEMVRNGTFREDLFYRLDVVSIALPPLRERADDIPLLVHHFLDLLSDGERMPARRHVSAKLMQRLIAYRWPGNVRELRNVLESMMVMGNGDTLFARDLPERIAQALNAVAAAAPPKGLN